MSDKREYESWWFGDAEVMIKVVFAKNETGNSEFGTTTKHINGGFIDTRWWGESFTVDNTVNIPIVKWDKNNYGDRMKYILYEVDDYWFDVTISAEVTTTLPGGVTVTAKGSFRTSDTNDFMGDIIVNYDSNTKGIGTQYSTGSFLIWINQ